MALADAGVGAAHALAYPLGGNYRIPHGLANAVLLPHVMEFNLPAAQKHFAMIAQSMGETVEGIPALASCRCRDRSRPNAWLGYWSPLQFVSSGDSQSRYSDACREFS